MTAIIYDAFGEDGDMAYMNGAVGDLVSINTGDNTYRNTSNSAENYARCSVAFRHPAFGQRFWPTGTQSTAWFGARVSCNYGRSSNPQSLLTLIDANNIPRIQLVMGASSYIDPIQVYKINAAGAQTSLGTASSQLGGSPGVPDKLDVHFNYSTTGFINIYINKSLVFTYSGDITTDGLTELAGVFCSSWSDQQPTAWSECMLSDSDTRDMSMQTLAANGPGTLDEWTGAYTNVNEITVNDTNFDTTTTSGAIQRYAISPLTTGNYDIIAKVTSFRATQGGGSLTQLSLDQLIGGTNYASAPQNFPTAFSNSTFVEGVNPATGVAWTQSDINDAGRESGYKATT